MLPLLSHSRATKDETEPASMTKSANRRAGDGEQWKKGRNGGDSQSVRREPAPRRLTSPVPPQPTLPLHPRSASVDHLLRGSIAFRVYRQGGRTKGTEEQQAIAQGIIVWTNRCSCTIGCRSDVAWSVESGAAWWWASTR